MSDMKEIASELGAINRVVRGISDDFQGFGISFKEAQTAIADQKSAIDKLKLAVDDLDIKMAKNGQFIAPRKQVFEMPEVKKMFDYIRNTKSMAVNDGPSGGYLVHTEYLNYVFEKVRDVDEIRANATVLTTGTSALGIPTEDQDAGLEWVGETEDRPETDAPTFGQVNIPVTEAHAKIRMTRIMRDDASFDVESYITRKLIDRITRGEGKAFVSGKGTTVPEGLWACSKIGSIESTATAGSISADDLLDMTAEVPWALESECAFIMNKRTEVAIRKLKDSDGQYLWNPSLIDGMPSTFGGYRIVKAPSAPDIASSAFPVMYGALKDYAIVDRQGVELIVDETSATLRSKGQIEYQFNCRLGAAVVQPDSFIKLEVQ
mgnify:FL=1